MLYSLVGLAEELLIDDPNVSGIGNVEVFKIFGEEVAGLSGSFPHVAATSNVWLICVASTR